MKLFFFVAYSFFNLKIQIPDDIYLFGSTLPFNLVGTWRMDASFFSCYFLNMQLASCDV